MSYASQVSSSIHIMYPAKMPRSNPYSEVLSLRTRPYSARHASGSSFLSSGSNVFQEAVTRGIPYPRTMSKNIALCSLRGLSSSSLSQLQNTNGISTSKTPSAFLSMTALRRLREPGPLPVENQPSLSIGSQSLNT